MGFSCDSRDTTTSRVSPAPLAVAVREHTRRNQAAGAYRFASPDAPAASPGSVPHQFPGSPAADGEFLHCALTHCYSHRVLLHHSSAIIGPVDDPFF
jgi:hypothetical protein